MGETGPCGPCTEIHIDRGGPDSDPRDGASPAIGVNAGNERFLELWNNVFMEFNRLDDGRLVKLPAQHVDTGMGFERIVGVLQGKRSNYDTDVFAPIFARVGELAKRRYGSGDEKADIAFRVIADHVRAVSSAFADGALPSNTGRGYVLRRLIRRASRYGRQALGFEDPFLCDVAPAVAVSLGEVFPEIPRRMEHVQLLLRAEEESFGKTLGRGLVRFGELAGRVEKGGKKAIDGGEAYELYATYGFPRDLVELMARERTLAVDDKGWDAAEEAHRAKSKSEGKFKQLLSPEELGGLTATSSTYHEGDAAALSAPAKIVKLVQRDEPGRDVLVLDRSPFYPEGGGQVGDSGTIEAVDGSFRFDVADTLRVGPVVAHVGTAAGRVEPGAAALAIVDGARRAHTRRNHTATHLLHKALKLVLGEHVAQQGSYVGPDRLRFDFSHPKGVTSDELEQIERIVNERVIGNAKVATTVERLDVAKARGVVAMFGEKYGETVRVLDVGGWSLELCGGTHVSAAGDIGPFVIVSESAIQAGVRRIEGADGRGRGRARPAPEAAPAAGGARVEGQRRGAARADRAAAEAAQGRAQEGEGEREGRRHRRARGGARGPERAGRAAGRRRGGGPRPRVAARPRGAREGARAGPRGRAARARRRQGAVDRAEPGRRAREGLAGAPRGRVPRAAPRRGRRRQAGSRPGPGPARRGARGRARGVRARSRRRLRQGVGLEGSGRALLARLGSFSRLRARVDTPRGRP